MSCLSNLVNGPLQVVLEMKLKDHSINIFSLFFTGREVVTMYIEGSIFEHNEADGVSASTTTKGAGASSRSHRVIS